MKIEIEINIDEHDSPIRLANDTAKLLDDLNGPSKQPSPSATTDASSKLKERNPKRPPSA